MGQWRKSKILDDFIMKYLTCKIIETVGKINQCKGKQMTSENMH